MASPIFYVSSQSRPANLLNTLLLVEDYYPPVIFGVIEANLQLLHKPPPLYLLAKIALIIL